MVHKERSTATERELTHILVTELLAHQFCSPVQWVKVQDAIFRDLATERLIEIGPGSTLINMAKATLSTLPDMEADDFSYGLQRQLLSLKSDSDAIYYRPPVEKSAPDLPPSTKQPEAQAAEISKSPEPKTATTDSNPSDPAAAAVAAAAAAPTTQAALLIPDKTPEAGDIVTCLVACALKRPPEDIVRSQTIKALCGGRSTLQNEIIGDLSKEFGTLPDQAEDLEIDGLGHALADAGKGTKLGPCTTALVAKVASTKMPAGSGISATREYLEKRWNLSIGLQHRVLLKTIHGQPTSRLAGERELHAFLDGIVHDVFEEVGIDPVQLAASSVPHAATAVSITLSTEALAAVRSEQRSQDEALFRLYGKKLGQTVNAHAAGSNHANAQLDTLQRRLDAWAAEHGDVYEGGISPKFDVHKIRTFDSSWNWVIEDFFALYNAVIAGKHQAVRDQVEQGLSTFTTRCTPPLLDAVRHALRSIDAELPTQSEGRALLLQLERHCHAALTEKLWPFRHSSPASMPVLEINDQGVAMVKITPRLTPEIRVPSVLSTRVLLGKSAAYKGAKYSLLTPPASDVSDSDADASYVDDTSSATSSPRQRDSAWTPEVQTKGSSGWRRNNEITQSYGRWSKRAASDGISLRGKTVLLTGTGKNSIGSELVGFCVAAGARVFVTTSSYSKETVDYYQGIFVQYGAHMSSLTVLPFNGGSKQDIENLVRHIYRDLGRDLDYIVPFAAVSEVGRALDNIDDRSEMAHRIMLTNLLRLLGAVKGHKARQGADTHPTHVVLPLSPNHGVLGQDGLYAESKIGLEVLMNKWWSEDWRDYLSLCGAVIGWTRGTGLMNNNDVLSAALEELEGIVTFSAGEMAWHIMGLMDPEIAAFSDLEPLKVDLSGGMSTSTNLKPVLDTVQQQIRMECELKRALFNELSHEQYVTVDSVGREAELLDKKAELRVGGMKFPDYRREVQPLAQMLQDTVDLDHVPVLVGFGEAGPCGSARTRWEAECSGTFSIDGCLELAWMMGLTKYHHGPLRGQEYCGWIDRETGSNITDTEVKVKYEDFILQHTGIRRIEKLAHDLTEPGQEETLHEVVITDELEPLEVSIETAADLQRAHGDNVTIDDLGDGQASVIFRAGATLYIPKASERRRAIGSQMPTGWDARTYGIPDDIVAQVDPVTLYALVATTEALLSAGIPDPYELYQHVGVADVGNAVGSGLGGQRSLHAMFKQRYRDQQVQKDVLAETFINTTAAWINMLLIGSSGPIRTPVGACATALESVDTGFDLIRSGKAKVVLVGGCDTLERDVASEFANMQATINADEDAAAGREPAESSRPTTSTRAGFVEGEGCAIQILTTASLAIHMGLPIRAVIALSHTASDKIGRSVPAPGQGLLTIAAEKPTLTPSPLLDISYRRRRLDHRRRQIEEECELELSWIEEQRLSCGKKTPAEGMMTKEDIDQWQSQTHINAKRAFCNAQFTLGNDFWRDEASISPLRGALAVWGLTVDDLSFASLHGTSTRKNDSNETAVIQRILQALGRSKGNILPCVVQKSLLGHGKAAAGGFALNGCVQMLDSGFVPGNRNADNIDAELADRDLLFFPSRTYRAATPMRAFSVTSFGFGQKGAQVIGLHPRYLFAHMQEDAYEGYKGKVLERMAHADQVLQRGLCGGDLVQLKDRSVYDHDKEEEALLRRSLYAT